MPSAHPGRTICSTPLRLRYPTTARPSFSCCLSLCGCQRLYAIPCLNGGLYDAAVACTTADVAGQFLTNVFFGLAAPPPHNVPHGHHHAGSAETALQAVLFAE